MAPPTSMDNNASGTGPNVQADPGPAGTCYDPKSVEPCENFSSLKFSGAPGEIYDVTQLGEGLHFSALGGMAALAESSDGSGSRYALVSIRATGGGPDGVAPETEAHAVEWAEMQPGSYQVLDVWATAKPNAALQADLLALACDRARQHCVILGATHGDTAPMRTLFSVDLPGPVLAGLRGLTYLADAPCVYGRGLFCFDGAWRQELSPDLAPDLRDVSATTLGVAVNADGDVFYRASGTWEKVRVGDGLSPLRYASSYLDRISVMREDGLWIRGETTDLQACQQTPPLIAAEENASLGGVGQTAVDATGNVLWYWWDPRRNAQAWCQSGRVALSGAVVDWSRINCQSSTNLLLLTQQHIFSLFSRRLLCVLR